MLRLVLFMKSVWCYLLCFLFCGFLNFDFFSFFQPRSGSLESIAAFTLSIFWNLSTFWAINCSWTKFIVIIVNVCVFFNAKLALDRFDFSSDFYALDFLRFAWSKILSQSKFQAAELNWRQFNAKSQIKSAPKPVQFFTLNLNSFIC